MLIQALINKLYPFDKPLTPVVCVIDNKQLHESLFSSKVVEDKRLHMDICGLHYSLERKDTQDTKRVAPVNQLADCQTKRTASTDRSMRVLALSEPLPAFQPSKSPMQITTVYNCLKTVVFNSKKILLYSCCYSYDTFLLLCRC